MSKTYRYFFLVFGISIVATILFTWPFVTNLATYYSDRGDYQLNGWVLWYTQDAFRTGRILHPALYFQSNQFALLPYSLAYSDHLVFPALLMAPLFWISKNLILTVNTYVFLSFVLSFGAFYYIAKRFTKDTVASIVGAIMYTFNPLVFAHLHDGHIQLLGRFFLPLLFFYTYTYLRAPTVKNACLFFLCFTLNGLTSIYFLICSIVVLFFFVPPCIIFTAVQKKKPKQYFSKLFKTSFFGVLFLPLLLYFSLPYLQFSKLEHVTRSLDENMGYAARLIDWTMATPDSLLYGGIVRSLEAVRNATASHEPFNYAEHTLFFNIIPLLLCILGIWYLWKKTESVKGIETLICFIVFFILLIVSCILMTSGGFYVAYFFIPLLHGIRVPTRFEFIAYVPFSLFASYGMCLLKRQKRYYRWLILAVILGLFLENIQRTSYSNTSAMLRIPQTTQQQYYTFLHGKTTLHMPVLLVVSPNTSAYLNWTTFTHERMLNGYSGYFPIDWIILLYKFREQLDETGLQKLAALHIDYLVIHKDLLKDTQLSAYIKNKPLYMRGIVYEDARVLFVDITKYRYRITPCDMKKDFAMTPQKTDTQLFLTITNKSKCYLASLLEQRYKSFPLIVDNKQVTVDTRFPLLISPYETIRTVAFPR